jgi:GH25 family lysozyme M1 (1,4-beta-N-acetylmuramidase)
MFKGIDVSHNNGIINWSGVKSAGINFAMIRAGYAKTIDRQFRYNIVNALAAGINCGSYWFSYAANRSEAVAEAKVFLSIVKPYKLTYPLAFDFEYASVEYAENRGIKITPVIACDIADGFMMEIAKAGYYIVNYTNNDYISRYFTQPCMDKFEVWLARWTNSKPTNITGIWQNEVRGSAADVAAKPPRASVVGSLSGITGAIDMDISYKDYPYIIRSKGLNHLMDAAPVPVPVPKPVIPVPAFKHGDKAKVINITTTPNGAKYGKTYTNGMYRIYRADNVYDVIGNQSGDRVCIGIGTAVTAAVSVKNLERIIK